MIIEGDCCTNAPLFGPFDMILADPPYGDTSLTWDVRTESWIEVAKRTLVPTGSLWVFGSLRYFMSTASSFEKSGFKLAQEIIWEKQNGSSFHTDRFKRVHELIVQFYHKETPWKSVYNQVQKTMDVTARTVRRKKRPPHTGHIEAGHYTSEDGGPRIMRSVIYHKNCHGFAIHPTEKPTGLLDILLKSSCPPTGLVGDFFAGSAAVGESCLNTEVDYIGFETDAVMAAKARTRLESIKILS